MIFDDIIVGTAGHIDHGKSSLVRALTGTDPDRLPEEKARGITLVLGFASRTLPSGRTAAFVDVPGHEALVRTMVSGATGFDTVVLVVAADDGVMPQTREHLAICRLLGVPSCIVALTKIDAVDADLVALAREDAASLCASEGLPDAPIVPVSSVTGEGLDALLSAIDRTASARRKRLIDAPARLPIDRSFLVKGHGLVVTGTLAAGKLAVGDAVEVLPHATGRAAARVRTLEVHGRATELVRAGSRVAVQASGLERDAAPAGSWLVAAGALVGTRAIDGRVRWLASCRRPLGRRGKMLLHVGTAAVPATVTLLDREQLEPGEEGLARVTTETEVVVRPGERGVLRADAAVAKAGATAAGFEIVRAEVEPYRARKDAAARLLRCLGASGVARAEAEASFAGARGTSRAELERRMPDGERNAVAGAIGEGRILEVGGTLVVARSTIDEATHRLSAWLDRALADEDVARIGIPMAEARPRAGRGAHTGVVDRAIAAALAKGALVLEDGRIRRKGSGPSGARIDLIAEAIAEVLSGAGLAPPRVAELPGLIAAKVASVVPRDVTAALALLDKQGRASRVSSELWFDRAAVEALKGRVLAHFERARELDAQTFKELTGQSRKYAIPLAEHLDQARVTVRSGDVRRRWGA